MANDYSLNNGTGNNIYSRSSFNTQVRPATSAPSSALTEGAHFRGQVTNITPNEIHLTTDSGKEIVARYNNNTDLSIGDSAKFVVTSNENGVITIKPDMGSASGGTDPRITNAIIKVLENADLPSTKENVSMIETMLKYNMPVGKEAVNSMIRSLHRFPSADPSAVITMMHNGIPVTSENIAQFTNYANLNGQLTEYMSAVTEEILSLLDNLTASMQGAEGLDKNAVITFLKDIFTQFNAENIDEGLATSYGDEAQFTGVPEILSSENLDAILTGNETTGFKVTESGLPIVTLSGNEEPSDGVLLNDAAIDATDPEELSALAKHLEAETLKDVITPKYNIPISEAEDYLQFLMSKGEYTLFSGNDDPNLSDLASATLQVAGNLEETDLKELFNHPVFKKLLDIDFKLSLLK